MERRVRWKSHARCGMGEKPEIASKVYLSLLLIRLEKQMRSLSSSINKLNTIISTKLGIVIDTGDSDHVAWGKALNSFIIV